MLSRDQHDTAVISSPAPTKNCTDFQRKASWRSWVNVLVAVVLQVSDGIGFWMLDTGCWMAETPARDVPQRIRRIFLGAIRCKWLQMGANLPGNLRFGCVDLQCICGGCSAGVRQAK
ncbi:MAG: hypothetical protein C5B50_26510 [Verrucomicrobia bacterium]|nr:MAG: hypothetical protein C5B50_26510 [Verrucomicrobiota bacterium]